MHRIVVTHFHNRIIVAYLLGDKAVELQLFTDNPYPVGTIFSGMVSKNLPSISASFVDIAPGLTGFLQNRDHKCGELIPVQLVKEGTKEKAPKVSDALSVTGKFAVVYAKSGAIRASAKLDPDIKKTLLASVKEALGKQNRAVILRTNAASADIEDIICEIRELSAELDRIEKYAHTRTKSVLYSPGSEWAHYLAGMYTDHMDEIITDDPALYEEIRRIFPDEVCERDQIRLTLYEDHAYPLVKLCSLEKHLKDAMNKRVWLDSGAFLVIEKTEALISIDVNSGKSGGKADKEETFFAVNLEAAQEIARQIRLRNLSGIIMIDFINMGKGSHQSELLSALKQALKGDPVKTQVHGMTSLGLVEMTRMKGRKTLYEQSGSVSDDETLSGDERRI